MMIMKKKVKIPIACYSGHRHNEYKWLTVSWEHIVVKAEPNPLCLRLPPLLMGGQGVVFQPQAGSGQLYANGMASILFRKPWQLYMSTCPSTS